MRKLVILCVGFCVATIAFPAPVFSQQGSSATAAAPQAGIVLPRQACVARPDQTYALDHADSDWCNVVTGAAAAVEDETTERPRKILSEHSREQLQRRLRFRLPGAQGPQ